jgi:hypothetical protein
MEDDYPMSLNMEMTVGIIGAYGAVVIVRVVFPRVDEGVLCDRDQDPLARSGFR